MADKESSSEKKTKKSTTKAIKRKKKQPTEEEKTDNSAKKRKLTDSSQPSLASTSEEHGKVVVTKSKKKVKFNSDEEWEDSNDAANVTKFGIPKEESGDRFKLETVHSNLQFAIIDEICLEGLDGITLEALWTRLAVALNYTEPFPHYVINYFWNIIASRGDVEFFKLEEPRPPLVIYDRFKERDTDLGQIFDPVVAPLDIYPYKPVSNGNVLGSAASFESRKDVSSEVRKLSLAEAEKLYGSSLVLVGSQRMRKKAIFNSVSDPLVEYTSMQYCLLERIARSRYLGEITQGKVSLQAISKDTKVIFYNRKILGQNHLVTKQPFHLKTPQATHLSGSLFHIVRFYRGHKTKTIIMIEQIVEYLRNQPENRIEYSEVKKTFGHAKILKKLFKLPEFQKFVKIDVPRFCRELYPDNTEKWLCPGSNKEKVVRTLELIDPNINVSGVWCEDEANDESSDEETTRELMYNIPILHQIYDLIRQAGSNGCSLKEIQANMGLDFYSTRAAVNQLTNQKIIVGSKIDMGRLRIIRYQSTQSHPSNVTINVEQQEEKKHFESEAIDFLSDLLEVEPEHLTASPVKDPPLQPLDSDYTYLKKLRQQNKQTSDGSAELINAYKNEHGYTLEKRNLTFNDNTRSIPKEIFEGIARSWPIVQSSQVKRKRLMKFYQKIKQVPQGDCSYLQGVIKMRCPLMYQSLMCEESYRRLLKNALKLSRMILMNCGYTLKDLPPRKRHMCKQQLPWEQLKALAESHPSAVDAPHESFRQKPDVNQENVNQIEVVEEEVTAAKEIFMGPKPTLAYESLDGEGISVAVWISTVPEEFTDTDLLYIKLSNETSRGLKRANSILDAVKKELVITDIYSLHRAIQLQEQEEGYNVKADRKSFQRIYARLVKKGLIKVLQIVMKSVKTRRVVTVLCDTSLDVRHSIIESVIEQLKMKIFVPKKKSPVKPVDGSKSEVRTFDTTEITSSVGELQMLADNDYEYKYNRSVGKEYGYVSKFLRMRVLHEFLFHIIYNYPLGQEVTDVDNMLKEFDVVVDEDDIKDMPKVYCREVSWKMFIPPLTDHIGWSDGWALVCDALLRLPLSLFVKLCNITLVIPDLPRYLEHPVKQYYLVKQLPSPVRSGLLHHRKYIFSVHETLCRLAYIGLLQFGPQRLREKDQVFIFLNKNASLYDTTTTGAGYHYVEDKEYKKLQYKFCTTTDVETYWYEMWNICTHTNLGMRNSVVGTYITIEHLEAKPAMIETLKPQTPESAVLNDNGNIPGDRRGAAGLDSALWSHVKRNWNTITAQSRSTTASIQQPKKLKKLKKKKKEKLIKQNKKPPTSSKVKRKPIVIRKVEERVEPKKKKTGYDTIDKKLMENLKQSRSEWNYEEDVLLNICKLISIFLCPNQRKQIVYYTVIRDTLHTLLPHSVNKTSGACRRRLGVLSGSIEQQEYLQKIVKALICIPFIKKYFEKFYDHVQGGLFLREKQLNGAFVFLVTYFYENQHELQHIFETINSKVQSQFKPSKLSPTSFRNTEVFTMKQQDVELDVLAYNAVENVTRSTKSPKLYPDLAIFPKSEEDVILDTIKCIIHSTVAIRPDDVSCIYQLFRVYQGYSDEMLKKAVSEVRNSQMIIGKRTYKKQTDMKGLPITSKLFHFSFYYGFTQVTKYPVELFLEAHEFLLGIFTHRDTLLPSSGNGLPTECFEQGHIVALSEVVTNATAYFIVDFPKEVLILNPRIADHTELLRELAVRYKKMLTLIKDGSYFKDDPQGESNEKQFNRAPMIQRFLKTWFLSNEMEDDDFDKIPCDVAEENNPEKKRKRNVHMSTNQQILKSLNDDIHRPTPSTSTGASEKSKETLKTVHDDSAKSFEDYEKKLESLLSSKTDETGVEQPVASSSEENICHPNIFEKYLHKDNQRQDTVVHQITEDDPPEQVDTVESDPAINARMASIMNDDLSVDDVMKEMLNDDPSEERRVPNVIKLSRLLVKGLFPDLDEDEERLERLHQHFLVVCPDTNLTIDDFANDPDLTYLYSDHPLVCKKLLHRVQKDIIVNDNVPTHEEVINKFKLKYSEADVSVIESLLEFISKKKILGASAKDVKVQFRTISKRKLSNFLNALVDLNVILRTGIIYTIFVHCRHRKFWLVESCALEQQDRMILEKSKTEEQSDVDLPSLVKSLDSYTEMKLHVKPWARIDGTLNSKLFEKWLSTVLGHCLADMSISLSSVIKTCSFLKPIDVYYLVECLQDIGCVQMNVFETQSCWLTTEMSYMEPEEATVLDEFDDIFIETDKLAIIKFGTLLNKKSKEFDFPTDVAKKHGTF